jgi:tetratricopeptide (TPR) repeat protein
MTRPAERIVFVAGTAAFVLAFLVGAVAAYRSEERLPAPDLLLQGPALHIGRLLAAKDYARAVRHLRAYEHLSNDRLPHEQLGQLLVSLGPEARDGFAQALRADGAGYVEGHYQLGVALEAADEHERAAAELAEAVRLRPDFPEAQNALGVALINAGQVEKAAAHFQEAAAQGYAPALENLQKLQAMLEESEAGSP